MCVVDKLCVYILISFIPSVLLRNMPLNNSSLLQAEPVDVKQHLSSEAFSAKINLTSTLSWSPEEHHHTIGKNGVNAETDATHLSREDVTRKSNSHSSHEQSKEDKSTKKKFIHGGSHEHDSKKEQALSTVTFNTTKNQPTHPSITSSTTTIHPIILNRTTVKAVPSKPTRPVPEDINFILASKHAEHYAPCLEANDSKETKTADIVVLVIAVIFSVPLIAIVISILYKKWTDWWQHRNYRRMDFLIEGMYNN